ncbi:hypothetical protein NC651_013164 [Populus alba x Populus x berolinensis]|nr:hypothetical protein NC651_013164 [Populus alba x Populus x berolinensis]
MNSLIIVSLPRQSSLTLATHTPGLIADSHGNLASFFLYHAGSRRNHIKYKEGQKQQDRHRSTILQQKKEDRREGIILHIFDPFPAKFLKRS